MTMISDNLQHLHARIAAACTKAGRAPESVRLLAVSKKFGPDAVRAAYSAGQTAFGENYVQEGVEKILALQDLPLQWHCIGPIQSNKTQLVATHFDWVQSVDRLKIAQRLSDQRPSHLAPLQVCIQLNVDGAPSKAGVTPQDALALAHAIAALPGLQLRGVMSIPDDTPDLIALQAHHALACAVFDALKAANLPGNPMIDTLSIGMSADLETAILAGATLVRVGTAIFGQRSPASA